MTDVLVATHRADPHRRSPPSRRPAKSPKPRGRRNGKRRASCGSCSRARSGSTWFIPSPARIPADLERARPFMERLERFMRERVDSDMIDREGKIPPEVVQGLGEIGAFGIKIPTEYGGLGLCQYSYTHAIGLVTSQDGNLTALLSAAQSIGVPDAAQAVRHAGAEEEVPPAPRQGRHLRVRAHREPASAPIPPALATTATLSRRRHALHPERREALVHQRHHRRADGGDGAHRAEEDHRVHRRGRLARRRGGAAAPLHGAQGASRTASSASPT